jgi:hypothetical protein
MPSVKTWQAIYPLCGLCEATATVVALGDGSFLIAVAAAGGKADRRHSSAPLCRQYSVLSGAQARADAMVVALLGRRVVGQWADVCRAGYEQPAA